MQRGLTQTQVNKLQKQYGLNEFGDSANHHHALIEFLTRFKNPLVLILLFAAGLSLFFGDAASFVIISLIVSLSVGLDFFNTYRSEKAVEALKNQVRVMATVRRENHEINVPTTELVPGDIVVLSAGKVVPADGEVVEYKDLFTNESALTGESFPQRKPNGSSLFAGSGVVSGEGLMKVTATGTTTKFAHIAADLQSKTRITAFEREIKDFSSLIIRMTFVLVFFVLVVNVTFHHDILKSVLFSLALAVGLTPELLPLIITLNLSKGSLRMAGEGVIVKQLSAVQDFGSMDILCTDKTGTLTEDKIALVKYVDGDNEKSEYVLKLGYLSSLFSTSFQNPLDDATLNFEHLDVREYKKIAEIPFDFERKRESVVAEEKGRCLLITKGAPEEMLQLATYYKNSKTKLTPALHKKIKHTYDALSLDGFRVLAVASKPVAKKAHYTADDETNLCFHGFLAFLDPAKASVSETLKIMENLGIQIKIITGDNQYVTEKIARDINLAVMETLTGEEIDKLNQTELQAAVEKTSIFARVNPEQKMQIIQALQANGHVIGYMGDGINDAPSLRAADVGISVDNAVDVAKDAADFILLRKSLRELTNGIIEGRRTFANTMKYLRMSLSSNFGNMFSMAGASLFLPFLPMLATQILLNNLLYDASQFAIPLDNVDDEAVIKPQTFKIADIRRFMWAYGILSSVFDFVTFGTLLLVFHADEPLFQAGWFIESIITQVLVVYVIRTRFVSPKDSRPSPVLVLTSALIITAAVLVITTPLRHAFHFNPVSFKMAGALAIIVSAYLVSAQALKRYFYARA